MLVVFWGTAGDQQIYRILREVSRLGADTVLLDDRSMTKSHIDLFVDSKIDGVLTIADRTVDLQSIDSLYARPVETATFSDVAAPEDRITERTHVRRLTTALLAYCDISAALVVNRPSAGSSNSSKPLQLRQLAQLGFTVPDTIITTDIEEVTAFWDRHGEVIYKSISGIRSRVRRLRHYDADRLTDVTFCPVQFQQWIPGLDVRVHVVGDEVFACEIESGTDDYRFTSSDDGRPLFRSIKLPETLESRCRSACSEMGLLLAGIDFRHTKEDEWYCLEINPCPAFAYYERETGHDIARAVARLLLSGNRKRDLILPG